MSQVLPDCQRLWNSIQHDDLFEFQSEMRNIGDVNRAMNDKLGWTPLCLAAYYGRAEMVSILLNQYRADVETRLSMGASALFVACEHGRLEVVTLLLRFGANPNAACVSSGTTPLIKACESNFLDIVKVMVDEGNADPNLSQADGSTPLFMAAQKGNVEVCQYLISKGADPDKSKLDSATPLIVASELGQTEVIRFLVQAGAKSANKPMYNGVTPLYKACEHGNFEIVKILIEAGVDPDLPKNDGVSPLFTACQMGHLEIIKFLAEQCHADINKAKNDGVTPVYMAAEYRNTAIVQYLVDLGADLSRKSINGLTALHAACIQHVPETVEILIQAKADLEARDNGGFSPLCNACEWGRSSIVALLLSYGADPSASGWNGNKGIHLAAWKGYYEIVQQFMDVDANIGIELINSKNKYGYTALHLAALAGSHVVARTLLKSPIVEIDALNLRGNTTLHCAVESGNHATVEEISMHTEKVDPYRKNILGMTALDLARQLYPPGDDIIQTLLKYANAESGTAGIIPAHKFVEVASRGCPNISLENVKILKKQFFLEAAEIPPYSLCADNQWHCDAGMLTLSDKVLFVSHRYNSESHPDPTCEQYNLIKNFLLSPEGECISYIWVDYSCVCQDRESEVFGYHLTNIPTALWCSTHCLVVPNVVQLAYNVAPDYTVPTTHLSDFLGRGWCTFEALAALLTGRQLYCSFQVGSHISHEKFDRPEGAASSLGFFMSYIKVWNHLFQIQQEDMMNVNLNILEEQWRSLEPCAMLKLLVNIATNTDVAVQHILIKAITFTLSVEDIENCEIEEIKELRRRMGICSVEQDKLIVMNLMLFIGYYSMNLFKALQQIEEIPEFNESNDN